MALTESEKTELKNDILNAIKAESQSVDELVEVSSLDNIKSLPALRGSELVSAPLTLLQRQVRGDLFCHECILLSLADGGCVGLKSLKERVL